MSGSRLLDAARLVGAARAVAKEHGKLRARQWDVFTQTSSLAKAVKGQTDRVTVTAGAAYQLAKRFGEDAQANIQSNAFGGQPRRPDERRSGLDQDHHYRPSESNATRNPPASGNIHPAQEQPRLNPLPDGTIPPEHTHLEQQPSVQGKDTYAQRPRSEPSHEHLSGETQEQELDPTQKQASRYSLPDGTIPPAGVHLGGSPGEEGDDVYSSRPTPEEGQHPSESGKEGIHPASSGKSSIPTPSTRSEHSADTLRKMQRASEHQIPEVTVDAEGVQPDTQSPGDDVSSSRSDHISQQLSSLPRKKIPKTVEDHQGSDEHVKDQSLNQDVFYSTEGSSNEREVPALDRQDSSSEVDTNIFHSPRISSLLQSSGKEDQRRAYAEKIEAARRERQMEQAKRSEQPQPDAKVTSTSSEKETTEFAQSLADDVLGQQEVNQADIPPEKAPYEMRQSKVPSSRFGRFWQYSGLATSMAFGAVGETMRRVTGGGVGGSLMLSEANMERLVAKLSRMRGAALKLGQMMSFQDSKLLPPAINEVLQRVQDSADYMPVWQRDQVLSSNLGDDWQKLFSKFEDKPIAAASIGQVHKATMASTGMEVAVKVQYPGVKNSIDSDLNNLSLLLTASRLLPKGLYLDKTIANARVELAWECDYVREAECGKRFYDLLQDETDTFRVPRVVDEACGPEVLTAELMHGKAVTKIKDLTQEERDWIGSNILRLCLRELMEWRFMQTDPNWTNFLFNRTPSEKLELLDFGASREFPVKFIEPYIKLLIAASRLDRSSCRDLSIELGYLTGHESEAMLNAHVDSILTLAEPFREDIHTDDEGRYDFRDQTITDRVREKIGLMLKERLAPPPEETYSLHRKLSGAFLLCARLGTRVPARQMFVTAVDKWQSR